MEFIALAVALLAAGLSIYRDRYSPLAWVLCMWAAIFVLYVLRPVRLEPLNGTALLAISLGLVGLALPSLLPKRAVPQTAYQGNRGASFKRFVVVSAVALVLLVVGMVGFRMGIAAATGSSYESLTLTQVRAAENGIARGGGLIVLLGALGPVVSCLGIYGAYRFSRWWWLLSAAAFALVAQNPARILLLSVLVISVVFWLYARTALSKTDEAPGRRRFPIVATILAVLAGLAYFVYVGAALSKNGQANAYSNWLPGWMTTPVMYFLGGISAFSVATRDGFMPYEWGTTIFTPLRILGSIFPGVHAPNTIAQAVHAPMWINIYTGFGQLYFDFGAVGVFVGCALIGTLAVIAHRRAERGYMEWAWVAAALAAVLFSTPQAFRFLNLDVLFELVAGFVAFYIIRWRKPAAVSVSETGEQDTEAEDTPARTGKAESAEKAE